MYAPLAACFRGASDDEPVAAAGDDNDGASLNAGPGRPLLAGAAAAVSWHKMSLTIAISPVSVCFIMAYLGAREELFSGVFSFSGLAASRYCCSAHVIGRPAGFPLRAQLMYKIRG